jgi:hypothetical protein
VQSTTAYLKAGISFGFCLAMLDPSETISDAQSVKLQAGEWIEELDRTRRDRTLDQGISVDDGESTGKSEPPSEFKFGLSAPNQQLYLCFAIVSMPEMVQEYRGALQRTIDYLRLHPNLPHGPQGQMLQTQLDIIEPAIEMARVGRGSHNVPFQARRALARLANRYAASIEAARRNTHLWTNLWAPVDYVDLELVATSVLLARASQNYGFFSDIVTDPIASIPFQIAAEIIEMTARPRSF